MLGAIPIDTFIFIALVLIASFFRWIAKEAEKAKRKSGQDNKAPVERMPVQRREETDEDRVRRFLEALGQPASARPPTPIQPRSVTTEERRVSVPRQCRIFSPLPPLTTVPPPLPAEKEARTLPPPIPLEPEVTRVGVPLVLEREKMPALTPVAFPETPQESPMHIEVVKLLSSARGLRDAVILREVFGPPRSLQTLEL